MKAGALCAGAAMLVGATQADPPEERDPAFRALIAAIEMRDAAALEAITRRDIMSMRLEALLRAEELAAMLEGCAIISVQAPAPAHRLIRFACPQRQASVPQGSCESGNLRVDAEAIGGRIRLLLVELRSPRPECLPAPPPPPAPPRRPGT